MGSKRMSDFTVGFSLHLRDVMRTFNVYPDRLARHLGYPSEFVAKQISGTGPPDTEVITAIAEIAGIAPWEVAQQVLKRMGQTEEASTWSPSSPTTTADHGGGPGVVAIRTPGQATPPRPPTPAHHRPDLIEKWPSRNQVNPGVWSIIGDFPQFLKEASPSLSLAPKSGHPGSPNAGHGKAPAVEVYIDEVGDLGFSNSSSKWFAMGAVMIPREWSSFMALIIEYLQSRFTNGEPLHWVEHIGSKRPARRDAVTRLLGMTPGVQIIYAITHKATTNRKNLQTPTSKGLYQITVEVLIRRVAAAALEHGSGRGRTAIRLGSINSVDTVAHGARLNEMRADWPGSSSLIWPPTWHSTKECAGIQVADQYMGVLWNSVEQDCDSSPIRHVAHQLLRSPHGRLLNHGFMVRGSAELVTRCSWWPALSRKPT